MELISISHLGKNKQLAPVISFSLSGNIRLNLEAAKKLNVNCLTSTAMYYLHFYKDGDKFFCSFNEDHRDGVYVRFDGNNNDRALAKNIIASARGVIKHLTEIMDWPLAENKKQVIRYQVGNEVKPGIFELI